LFGNSQLIYCKESIKKRGFFLSFFKERLKI